MQQREFPPHKKENSYFLNLYYEVQVLVESQAKCQKQKTFDCCKEI